MLDEGPRVTVVLATVPESVQARPSQCKRWQAVVLASVSVVALLFGLASARQVGGTVPSGQFTDAPKTDEMPFPQQKPTSGFLLDRRSADK